MAKNYKIGEMSELLGVSITTLRRWDEEGILKAYRTVKGTRYYTYEQYLKYVGRKEITFIYVTEEQRKQLIEYANKIDVSEKK
ncbi:helix-turn-helix domain-containing protein [Clostridioides difficile]|nr:helix-turn-helix domain-containing protein [Clostridioides difficile]MCL6901974.1 helix-turn-helix domain-containing protein [Clostridioides difficile]MCP3377846.1 helix-turn-helix domain-containing protein [Clostridioides difficile]MDE3493476.1 helix-turn-helix domain-containing protein [Clostridioides difficile]MDE3707873.1 helix-turn-helix domain-containing protein [Clostridioides difficile]